MNLPSEYIWDYQICTYDVGPNSQLRLSNLLRLQQEAGERHLAEGQLAYQNLAKMGMAFLVVRANLQIERLPGTGEKVKVCTWHRGEQGAAFYRCFQILSEQGEKLVDSVTAYALVDPGTKRLLRPKVFLQLGIQSQDDKTGDCPDPERLKLPENLEPAGVWKVRVSDTDWNHHLNNAAYLDILWDFLPEGVEIENLGLITVCFLSQALPGDEISVFRSIENGELYMRGVHGRGPCFEIKVKLKPHS